jgi:hypothetical protein
MVRISLAAAVLAAGSLTVVVASPAPKRAIGQEGHKRDTTSFWYANIDHTSANVRGYAPDLDGDYNYEVYKAVAPGDGAGIQAAITSSTNGTTRHGQWLASQPRVQMPANLAVQFCMLMLHP